MVKRSYISGLSLLGGEPFEACNQRALLPLIRRVKALENKTIWAYSGYTYETDLLHGGRAHCEVTDEILTAIDVLVDGEYVEGLKNISLQYRGSENKRILNLKELHE